MNRIIRDFSSLMRAELIKIKRSPAWWLTLFSAALLPVVYFIVFVTHKKDFFHYTGNPWSYLFNKEWQMLSFLLLPLYIILVASLVMQIEYKAKGWKNILTLPVTKEHIYLSKLLVMLLIIAACYLFFILFTFLSGIAVQLFYPEPIFFTHRPDFNRILHTVINSFISVLGIVAFQFWISLRSRNFAWPLGIGIAGVLVAMIVFHHWRYQDLYFYVQPVISLSHSLRPHPDFAFSRSEWFAILYFVLFSLAGCFDFKRRKEY